MVVSLAFFTDERELSKEQLTKSLLVFAFNSMKKTLVKSDRRKKKTYEKNMLLNKS